MQEWTVSEDQIELVQVFYNKYPGWAFFLLPGQSILKKNEKMAYILYSIRIICIYG